jgi:peptide/nickel transport system substrate-binding protein
MYRLLFRSLVFIFILSGCDRTIRTDLSESIYSSPVIHLPDTHRFAASWSRQNILVAHLSSEPDNLHPAKGSSAPRNEVLQYTQSFLIITDYEKQELAPGLISELPEVSGDNTRYTYVLRGDARWDNGEKLSPDDVIFTAKAYTCELTQNPVAKAYWENVRRIEKDSANPMKFTMVMKVKHIHNVSFLSSFCIMQRSFHDPENTLQPYTLEQFNDTNFKPGENHDLLRWANEFNNEKYGRDPQWMNGLGPYKLTSWEPGQSITLEKKTTRNSAADDLKGSPDKIIFKINRDENSTQLEIKNQTIDVSCNLTMGSFINLASDPDVSANYHTALTLSYNYSYYAFNTKPDGINRKVLFSDRKVRRAFAHLTPVDDLMKLVYRDYSSYCRRMVSNVSPLKPNYNPDLKEIKTNRAEADRLLQEAGWTDTDGDGILDKVINGQKTDMKVEIMYLNTNADWKDMALLTSESFKRSGIETSLLPVDLRMFQEKARSHDFDLLLSSWAGIPFPEDYTVLWHSESWRNNGSNFSGFGNEASDALIDSLRTESDPVKRKEMDYRFQEMVYDEQPFIFLFCSMRRNLVHKRFGNVSLFSDRPGILLSSLKLLSTTSE